MKGNKARLGLPRPDGAECPSQPREVLDPCPMGTVKLLMVQLVKQQEP